jgi:hypothetical protein
MLQVMVHGREPSPMEFLLKQMCGVMTAKKGCKSSWIVELSTFWYVGFQPFFLLSYNFLQFDEFIFFLSMIHITVV